MQDFLFIFFPIEKKTKKNPKNATVFEPLLFVFAASFNSVLHGVPGKDFECVCA